MRIDYITQNRGDTRGLPRGECASINLLLTKSLKHRVVWAESIAKRGKENRRPRITYLDY